MPKINELTHNIIVVNRRIKETVNNENLNERWLKVFNSLASELFNELAKPTKNGSDEYV